MKEKRNEILIKNLIRETIRMINELGEDAWVQHLSGINPDTSSSNYIPSNTWTEKPIPDFLDCKVDDISDDMKNAINQININIKKWVEEKIVNSIKNKDFDNEYLESTIKASYWEGYTDDVLWKTFITTIKDFLEEYIESFRFFISNVHENGGGPCENVAFNLNVPIVKKDDQKKFIEKSIIESAAKVFEKEVDNIFKDYDKYFEKAGDNIINSIANGEFNKWVEEKYNWVFNRQTVHAMIVDMLLGGAITLWNIKDDLRGQGLSEDSVNNWRNIVAIDSLDYWSKMYLVIKSGKGITNLLSLEYFFIRLAALAGPVLLLMGLAEMGVWVVEDWVLSERVIETYNSSIKKIFKKAAQKWKSNSKRIIEVMSDEFMDLSELISLIEIDEVILEVENEIEKTLSRPIEELDQGLNFWEAAAMTNPLNQWNVVHPNPKPGKSLFDTMYDSILLAMTNYDRKYNLGVDLEKEAKKIADEKYNEYQKSVEKYEKEKEIQERLSKINTKYKFDEDMLDAERKLALEDMLKKMDHNEWYRKAEKPIEKDYFSPREAQFLNDIFKITKKSVNQKEKGSSHFSFLKELSFTQDTIKGILRTTASKSLLSVSTAIQLAPASLDSISNTSIKMIKNKVLDDLMKDLFSSFEYAEEIEEGENYKIDVVLKKEKYELLVDPWRNSFFDSLLLKNDPVPEDLSNYENLDPSKIKFPLIISFVEKKVEK